jgi:HSP20 family molecular chaperone IbpA
MVGVDPEIAGQPIGTLSGGQFQRLLLAFALMGRPSVHLFDEPTAGVDEPGEEGIYTLIRRLQETEGLTVLLISHERFADRDRTFNARSPRIQRPHERLRVVGAAAARPTEQEDPMKLTKSVPALGTIKQDIDRAFERFFEPRFWPPVKSPAFESLWEPVLDLSETDKEFVVRLEAPGMARDDFDVTLDRNLLTLSGKRQLHKEEKGENYLWEERQEGRFLRTMRLPSPVQEEKIDAGYANGILTVRLPKSMQPPKARITVK